MSGSDAVHTEWNTASHTLTLRLHHPERANALTHAMLTAIADTLDQPDPDVAQIVLRGADDRFSSGIDLSQRSSPAAPGSTVQDALNRATRAIRHCSAPVVALIEGHCVGAALELAVTCDLRVAVRPARFEIPATRIGVVYRPAGYDALLRRLGVTAVRRLMLGMRLDADSALQNGIVDGVYDSAADALHAIEEQFADLPRSTFHAQKLALDTALASRSLSPAQEQAITDLRRHGAPPRTGEDHRDPH